MDTKTRRKHARRNIILVFLAVPAAITLGIFSRIENWKRDLTSNFAKLDPLSDDPASRPLMIPHTPSDAAEMIVRWVQQQPRWSVESRRETGSGIELHLTRQTRLIRFTDDIRVRLLSDGDATRMEAESQSRIGKGDLGQNPRNLRELVSGLREPG